MDNKSAHTELQAAAADVARAHGFEPEFPAAAEQQVADLIAHPPRITQQPGIRDMREMLWSSIDNETSRDLDQVEVAEQLPNGDTRILVGIADVDAFVPAHSPIDNHAAIETTTVYTGVRTFPMLPLPLSTGSTSLVEGQDRLAVVIEFVLGSDGTLRSSDVYRALIRNHAQLAYDGVGAWLDHTGPPPAQVAASTALQAQLELQNTSAQLLRTGRFRHGALNIETIETQPVLIDTEVVGVAQQTRNAATELIEDFMIAANGAVVRMLSAHHVSSIRRVVKTPARWDRLVELARLHGSPLPAEPDSKALNAFLTAQKAADPDHFADLSLGVIKLLGPGEYMLERPGDPEVGHFGLAVENYTHATAPNRRFADLVTQRLIKAVLAGAPGPYTDEALAAIGHECTVKEDAARVVEREMSKRIAAVAMSNRIGETFDGIVTGVTPKGTFVRVTRPPVEGLLARGAAGVDVGDKVRVTLIRTDRQRGYIDFARSA